MITVLSGGNAHAVREKLSQIKQEFIAQHGEGGVEVISGERLEPDTFGSLLGGATLFASHRLVIIKNLSQNKEAAERLLSMYKNVPEETQVVLVEGVLDKRTAFYKTLKKEASFHEFAELDERAAITWVSDLVQQEGGKIGDSDTRLLVQYAGTDQSRLTNEIAKLLAYDHTITKDSIEQLVEKNPEETVFQLLEYALSGQPVQAVKILEGLERAHEDPFQAANMLIWQTHILAVVASAGETSDGEIARSAKINPFVVKKTRGLARGLSSKQLSRIIDTTAELDVKLKTTSAEPWRLLEQTLLSF